MTAGAALLLGFWFDVLVTLWVFVPLSRLILAIFFLVGAVATLASRPFKGAPPKELDDLLPSPAPGESYLVHVVLRWRGALTGRDDAYAIFLDGWLHVEGLRTSFSLRACDVGPLAARRGGQELGLGGDQSVEFRPYGDVAGFKEALRIWHHYAIESPPGESVLPPLATL